MRMLRDFFQRVRKANLSLKHSKCKVGFAKVDFRGHTFLDTAFKGIQSVHRLRLLDEF